MSASRCDAPPFRAVPVERVLEVIPVKKDVCFMGVSAPSRAAEPQEETSAGMTPDARGKPRHGPYG
ncbi:MAG: hypothetical protein MUC50_24175 [Myxococcota bacterium]|jgi:hypothetical protein|nr:hypothetical protein [Myxococcota bacterium]